MRSDDRVWLAADDETAALRTRVAASTLAHELGFAEHRAAEVTIAASEIAGNLGRHAREGTVVLRVLRRGAVAGLELVAMDRGPGMDVRAARKDGFSSRGTLGIGLGAVDRLSDSLALHSVIGRGTVLAATFWPNGTPVASGPTAALLRPMVGETECGDAYAERCDAGTRHLLLADALGHGPLAAKTAGEAVRVFHDIDADGPAAMLERMHRRLRHTRGLAAAIVQLEKGAPLIAFAGVGNVAVSIEDGDRHKGLPSQPGILGHTLRRLNEVRQEVAPDSPIVLHTDGLTSRWSMADYPGLSREVPLLIAAALHRDAARAQDDAGIAVTRVA